MESPYNVPIETDTLPHLVQEARDWIWSHGVLVRKREKPEEVTHAPFVLLPTPFLRPCFHQACDVQRDVALLLHKVAYDHDFLSNTLEHIVQVDDFTKKMWNIYETVRQDKAAQSWSLGLLRADYMMDACSEGCLKQVEVNTIASGMGGLGTSVSEYSRYILFKMGVDADKHCPPTNTAADGLGEGLAAACSQYNRMFFSSNTVILFLVMEKEWNLYDQRAMEYATEKQFCEQHGNERSRCRVIRRTPQQMIRASLTEDNALRIDGMEVAVIYFRNLYAPQNYTSSEVWDVRLTMERSRAIKCPSVQYQLAGSKKVQQALALPGVVERFIKDPDVVKKIRATFAGLYPLEHNEAGDANVKMILESPDLFVLKPQREGGGNNIFGRNITGLLEQMKDTEERTAWIAMDRLCPVISDNYMVRPDQEVFIQEVNSELGIFGSIMGNDEEVTLDEYCGFLLRTKPAELSEGGTATGVGALDSPLLVEHLDIPRSLAKENLTACCSSKRCVVSKK